MGNKYKMNILTDGSLSVRYNISSLPLFISRESISSFCCHRTEPHWNDDLEIIYIRKGSMTMVVNGESAILSEGDICIINTGTFHYLTEGPSSDCTFYCGLANEGLFSQAGGLQEKYFFPVFHSFSPNYALVKSDNPYYTEITKIISDIGEVIFKQSPVMDLLIVAKLHEFIALLSLALPKEFFQKIPHTSEESEIFHKMQNFIHSHYSDDILVSDISDAGSISKRRCYSMFYQYTGKSPAEYLLEFRLNISRRLLRSSNLTLAQIAAQCGFSHQSHFTRCFSSAFSITPKKYRDAILNQDPSANPELY